jgi:nicotinate-nucleotide--dimethylbenzimidazole phosphoribosyltransferase
MLDWLEWAPREVDEKSVAQALAHQQVLTKPQGALGMLETVAVRMAGLQRRALPAADRVQITLFAADHGIATHGVSAYPQAVTAQMVANFAAGGAAISVLAQQLEAAFEVVHLGTVGEVSPAPHIVSRVIAPMSADFSQAPAMSHAQLQQALDAGFEAVERACSGSPPDLLVLGEMGIGNTSAATALAAALLQQPVRSLTGPGTGLQGAQIEAKAALIEQALRLHQPDPLQPLEVLRCLGGFEIAAMVGAYLRAVQRGIPLVIDGFISTAALLVAQRIQPALPEWCFFGHISAEPAHRIVLDALDAQPLLALGMRLGEGSGAAIAVDLIRTACRLHAGMATFAQAGVSDKT